MRYQLIVGGVLVCMATTITRSSECDSVEANYNAQIVRSWIGLDPSVYTGDAFLEHSIYRMGDSVALGVVYGFSHEEILDPKRLPHILAILRVAFSRPDYIACARDRTPRLTQLLLSSLEREASDRTTKESVETTEAAISAAIAKWKNPATP